MSLKTIYFTYLLKSMKKYLSLLFAATALFCSCLDDHDDEDPIVVLTSHFEDMQSIFQGGKTYWNGADGSGMLQDESVVFTNNYNEEWGSWDGFALSCSTSTSFSADNYVTDQYNCCVKLTQPNTFLVGYYSEYGNGEPTIYTTMSKTNLTRRPFYPISVNVANAAYTYNSIKNGDDYAKKFEASDYLYLYVTGYKDGKETKSLKLPLAEQGKILDVWGVADLQSLGLVDEIRFKMDSSDKGEWGINTPTYFCLDNLSITFPKEK